MDARRRSTDERPPGEHSDARRLKTEQKTRENSRSDGEQSVSSSKSVPDSEEDPEVANVRHLTNGVVCASDSDSESAASPDIDHLVAVATAAEVAEELALEATAKRQQLQQKRRNLGENAQRESPIPGQRARIKDRMNRVVDSHKDGRRPRNLGLAHSFDDEDEDEEDEARELEKLRKLVFVNASSEDGDIAEPSTDKPSPMDLCSDVSATASSRSGDTVEDVENENNGRGTVESRGSADRSRNVLYEPENMLPSVPVPAEDVPIELKILNQKPIKVRVLVPSAISGGYLRLAHDRANAHGEKALTKKVAKASCLMIRRSRISLSDKVTNGSKASAAAILIITDDRPLDAFTNFIASESLVAPPFGAYMCSKEDGDRLVKSIQAAPTMIGGFTLDKDRPVVPRSPPASYVPRLKCPFCTNKEDDRVGHTLCGCPNRENYAIVDFSCKFSDATGPLETINHGPVKVVDCQNAERARDVISRLHPLATRVPLVPWTLADKLTAPPAPTNGARLIRSPVPSQIHEDIYVGAGKNAGDKEVLKKYGIKAVFDCASQYNVRYKVQAVCTELGVDYCGIAALDVVNYPLLQHYEQFQHFMCKHAATISVNSAPLDELKPPAPSEESEVGAATENKEPAQPSTEVAKNILVVCAEGVNRSCTLTACFLLEKRAWAVHAVIERMRQRRRVALTNPHFRYLIWMFATRRNLPFAQSTGECAPILHVPLKDWTRRDIIYTAQELIWLGLKFARRLLDALKKEAPSGEDKEGASRWSQRILYAAHESIMRANKNLPFREGMFRVVLSWRLSNETLAPLADIWKKSKVLPDKLLRKIPKGATVRLDSIAEEDEEEDEDSSSVKASPVVADDDVGPQDDDVGPQDEDGDVTPTGDSESLDEETGEEFLDGNAEIETEARTEECEPLFFDWNAALDGNTSISKKESTAFSLRHMAQQISEELNVESATDEDTLLESPIGDDEPESAVGIDVCTEDVRAANSDPGPKKQANPSMSAADIARQLCMDLAADD